MKITKKWLLKKGACSEGREWFEKQVKTDAVEVLQELIKQDHLQWANWTIARVMDRKQKLTYAIFAAEQVIAIFEKKYPEDKRPRKAIQR